MTALAWIVAVTTLLAAYFCYRGWRYREPLLTEHGAYGVARAESREGSHRERANDDSDSTVRCVNCGAANERPFRFCRRCETPLC